MSQVFASATRPTILIVDDTPDNIALLSSLLRDAYKLKKNEKAVAIMREGRGTHFEPDILDVFLQIEDTFRAIARQFSDDEGA